MHISLFSYNICNILTRGSSERALKSCTPNTSEKFFNLIDQRCLFKYNCLGNYLPPNQILLLKIVKMRTIVVVKHIFGNLN